MTRRAWAACLLVLLMIAGITIIASHWQGNDTVMCYTAFVKPAATAVPAAWPSGTVNVNTADAETLQTLTGINQSQIEALLADRAENGDFDFPEDLTYVKGIGEKTLAKLYDQLDFTWRNTGN